MMFESIVIKVLANVVVAGVVVSEAAVVGAAVVGAAVVGVEVVGVEVVGVAVVVGAAANGATVVAVDCCAALSVVEPVAVLGVVASSSELVELAPKPCDVESVASPELVIGELGS